MIKKTQILRMLFSLFFSLYAISPLSYTHSTKNVDEALCAPERPSSLTRHFNIFVWELICTELSSREHDDGTSSVKILFKKSRATLPEDVGKKMASLEYVALHQGSEGFVMNPVARASASPCKQGPLHEFFPLCSGLSPPSA